MENIKYFEKMEGCDIKIMKDLRPRTGEKCVGASGLDKTLALQEVIKIASTMNNPRPNIIVKAGKNAKWYLKELAQEENLDEEIEKATRFRGKDAIKRATMWIIEWD